MSSIAAAARMLRVGRNFAVVVVRLWRTRSPSMGWRFTLKLMQLSLASALRDQATERGSHGHAGADERNGMREKWSDHYEAECVSNDFSGKGA